MWAATLAKVAKARNSQGRSGIMAPRNHSIHISTRPTVLLGLALLSVLIASSQVPAQIVPRSTSQEKPEESSDIYLVRFRPGVPASERAAAVQAAGALLRTSFGIANAVSVQAPNAAALARLRNDPRVAGVYSNHSIFLDAPPGP